jgi:hypothetical protein
MLNISKSRLTTVMTLILSLLALYASLAGELDKNLYKDLFLAGSISKFLMAGSLAQDMISIPLSLILAILSVVFLKAQGYKTFIAIMGLTGYFFYGYGLYAMQGQYTSIYLIYLAIFGLSIYSLIFGLTSFKPEAVKQTHLPGALSKAIGIFLMVILLVLIPVWLVKITFDIAKHIHGEVYGVFILDLAVVFPALGIIAARLLRKKPFGNILAGVALMKALTICLSVAFGEWFGPFYGGFHVNYGNLAIFSVLTVTSLVLFVLYMFKLKTEESSNG